MVRALQSPPSHADKARCLCDDNQKIQSTSLAPLNWDHELFLTTLATQPDHIEIFHSRDPCGADQLHPLYFNFSQPTTKTTAGIVTALFQVQEQRDPQQTDGILGCKGNTSARARGGGSFKRVAQGVEAKVEGDWGSTGTENIDKRGAALVDLKK